MNIAQERKLRMRMNRLNILAQTLNAALGSGQFSDLTYDVVVKAIGDGSILDLLEKRLDAMVPMSVLEPIDRLELIYEWQNLIGCVEPLRYHGHRNGLCLLVGYQLQGMVWRRQNPRYALLDGTEDIRDENKSA